MYNLKQVEFCLAWLILRLMFTFSKNHSHFLDFYRESMMFLNSFLSNSQIFAACDFNHSAFEQLIQAISSRHHYDYDRHYRSHSDSCHSEPPPVVEPHDDCPKDGNTP